MGAAQIFIDRADVNEAAREAVRRTMDDMLVSMHVPEGGVESVTLSDATIVEITISASDDDIDNESRCIAVEITVRGIVNGDYKVGGADTDNNEDEVVLEADFELTVPALIYVQSEDGEFDSEAGLDESCGVRGVVIEEKDMDLDLGI